jgi:hypothetical protein
MDKDEYFKILEETCSYNFQNYYNDPEWERQTTLSQIPKRETSTDFTLKTAFETSEHSKRDKIELNTMKYYE